MARSLLEDPHGGGRVLLDPAGRAALDAALSAGQGRVLFGERSISFDGSSAPRWAGEEIVYVASCRTEGGSTVAERSVLQSGTRLGLRALAGHPGDRTHVELAFDRSVLTEMTPFETRCGTIQLPKVGLVHVGTGLRIPEGETAIVAATRDGGTWQLLLLTPKRVRRGEAR